MKTSRRASLFAAIAVMVVWAGEAAADGIDEIRDRGQLLVAVYRDFPPYSSHKNEELVGIDVDIGREIAKRLKLPVAFYELTADESVDDDLRNAVWKGHYLDRRKADVMLHVPTEREFRLRQTEAVIFAPYYRETIVLARDPERVYASDGLEVFQKEKIGVELDSLSDIYLTYTMGGSLRDNVVHLSTVAQAVDAMLAGEVAAVMGTRGEVAASLRARGANHPYEQVKTPDFTKNAWEVGLAIRETNRELVYVFGDLIEAMRADGAMAAIFARHGIPYQPPED